MRVADILGRKGGAVHSVLAWRPVSVAIERLDEEGIGALVVCAEGQSLRGIITERDIVRGLRRHGPALLDMRIEDVMTRYVVTCEPDERITTAMARMTHGRHRHLPVVEEGRLVGMVSIGDIVEHRLREVELETGVLRDAFIAHH
jgi:CBS domain-containing protein